MGGMPLTVITAASLVRLAFHLLRPVLPLFESVDHGLLAGSFHGRKLFFPNIRHACYRMALVPLDPAQGRGAWTLAAGLTVMRPLFRNMIEEFGRMPGVGHIVQAAHARRFNRAVGRRRMFRGVFPTFEAAARNVPVDRAGSYDNEASAKVLMDERDVAFSSDYPLMFWMSQCAHELRTVFDWGGYSGRSYFVIGRYLRCTSRLTWIVNDVPAVVLLGNSLNRRDVAGGLSFTTSFDGLEHADLLIASGSLHFIQDPWGPLADPRRRPKHVLVDKIPAYDKPSAATLHNMGTAVIPQHLFNRAAFIGCFEALGYRLVDSWLNHNLGCQIPFHPDHSIPAYSGFYFRQPPDRQGITGAESRGCA